MKYLLSFLLLAATQTVVAQQKVNNINIANPQQKIQIVDVACGQCQFKMKGKKGCDLAVRINGKTYFVDGASIDSFGDAHESEGFCNAISKAEVQGTIVNNRFKATYFKPIKN